MFSATLSAIRGALRALLVAAPNVGLKQPGRGFPIRRRNAIAPASTMITSEEEHPYDALQSIQSINSIKTIHAFNAQ
jgi:hypothetical protein